MKAMVLRGGRIRPHVVVVKALASAICIGSGGSAGREGPIVQIGSAFGSVMGQMFHLSEERVKNLVACGAAGGIAATFNAPMAGVIFALEVILGEFTARYFGTVVISSVTASIVSRSLLGDNPAFAVPIYRLVQPAEMLAYLVLGLISAVAAVLFIRVLFAFEQLFDGWSGVPEWLKPAVGGALLGGLAVLTPEALGSGLEFIGETLIEPAGAGLMLGLALAKLLATSFTLGSGNSGGVFAPALFIGAMLGGGFGTLLHTLWPSPMAALAPAGAYALVGMAAVFAGAARAPITAVLILFEMSNDYKLILPLMTAVVASTVVAEWLHTDSIYTVKLSHQGIRLERGRDIAVMQGVLVGEVMTTEVYSVPVDMSLTDLRQAFLESHHHGFPVVDAGRLFGVVTLSDLSRAEEGGALESGAVRDIATQDPLVAYPDEPVWAALKRLGTRDVGRLPVVDRSDPHRLLGAIRRRDIVRAYQTAILRRLEMQERADRLRLGKLTQTSLVEVKLALGSPVIGRPVNELTLPENCLLIVVRRGQKTILPHGDTVLQAHDHLVALVDRACEAELRAHLGTEE